MTRIFFRKHKIISLLWIFLISSGYNLQAQNIPEIPASVSFGGITVKFDRTAQGLIETDIKNLMSNKKFWEEKMERAILFFPIVEGILMDEEVPIDFKYLAVQESSFKPDVVSSSNAVGYWQFKPETARELNLRVDDQVDERKNITSSTHAAAWYLKKNNQQFNNWVSSLYSYYQGAGAVKKIVPSNWAYAREVTLTGKTDGYMLRFFAHKIALEAGIEKFKSNSKIVLLESEYGKGQTFEEIAKSLKINVKDLENYNHWVTDGRVPTDKEYLITVPVPMDQIAAVREKLSLPVQTGAGPVAAVYDETGFPVLKKSDEQSSDKDAPVLYDINGLPGIQARPGDKPKTLAKAGKIRAPKFLRINDMLKDMPLVPGEVYYLAKKNKKAATPYHTAHPGDTWQSVSQQYGMRLVNLLKYNRTVSRNYPIQTGQVLWLTKKRPRKQPIEIITPNFPTPVKTTPEIAATTATSGNTVPAVTPSSEAIPEKASDRKKYTPVLVEKSESSIAKESQVFEPAVTPKITEKPVVAAKETDDRVVIITQDNTDGSFKSVDENIPVTKKNDASVSAKPKPVQSATAAAGSVYARQQREAAERAASEKVTPDEEIKEKVADKEKVSNKERESGHIVTSGETYYSIARKYGMDANELIKLNNKGTVKGLVIGQKIRIKGVANENSVSANVPETNRNVSASPTSGTFTEREVDKIVTGRQSRSTEENYTVQTGDTYYSISRLHGLSLKDLMTLNNLSPSERLVSGQKLRVRKSGTGSVNQNAENTGVRSSSSTFQTHTVVSGETLFRIAQNYGANIEDIKKLNNMTGNSVMLGQKLKIPQKQ